MKGIRPNLHINHLIGILRKNFETVPDNRPQSNYSLTDCFMSFFAVFHLKFPSLLAFDETYKGEEETLRHNLKTLYGVEKAPTDTTLRERLDGESTMVLRNIVKPVEFSAF